MSKMINSSDYTLTGFGIIKEEQYYDLSDIFIDIVLYESIFDQVMSGNATIVDSLGLKKNIPLIGDERIILEFNTDGTEQSIVFDGVIYKITEDTRASEHSSSYVISFTSKEANISSNTHISRGWKGTVSDIVSSIFKERLYNDKDIDVEETAGIVEYTAANKRPIKIINEISSLATGTQDTHGFVFYENNQQWKFTSLQALYQQDPTTEYFYSQRGVYEDVLQRHVESFQNIQEFEVQEVEKHSSRSDDGLEGSTHEYYDLVNKEFISKTYDKLSHFDAAKSLGTLPAVDNYKVDINKKRTFKVINDGMNAVNSHLNRMKKLELRMFVCDIGVFGDSTIKVGDVCLATLPSYNSEHDEDQNMVNGKFLITNIKHLLTKQTYMSTVTICKDAYVDSEVQE